MQINFKGQKMTKFSSRLSQISLALVVFSTLIFTACGPDMSKAPLIEGQTNPLFGLVIAFQSKDDTTIINKITVSGKDGVCKVDDDFGAGGSLSFMMASADKVLYGETILFNNTRVVQLASQTCLPKNGKYKVEVATNLGTYTYDLEIQ